MKKLIIVCEEKLRRYGDFLAQLISGAEEKDRKNGGLKDGFAAAQVWSEKVYASNAAQISSEQYILFVGNSKLIQEKRYHMKKRYSEYGMNYGWLGKQAVIFVEHALSYSEYGEFYMLFKTACSEGNQPEATRLLPPKAEIETNILITAEANGNVKEAETAEDESLIQEEKKPVKRLPALLRSFGNGLKKTADKGVETVRNKSNDLNAALRKKDIEDQQYTCLVLMFYLNDLASFLGLNEA